MSPIRQRASGTHLGSAIPATCRTRPQYELRSYCEGGNSLFPGIEEDIARRTNAIQCNAMTVHNAAKKNECGGENESKMSEGAKRKSVAYRGRWGDKGRNWPIRGQCLSGSFTALVNRRQYFYAGMFTLFHEELLGVIREKCFCSIAKYNSSTQIGITSEADRQKGNN